MSLEFFNQTDALGKAFWLCAIAGTLFFALRFVIFLVAGGFDDLGDSDFSHDHMIHGHHISDHVFEILSINSLTAFVMMFGWAGLAAHIQYQLGHFQSVLIALLAGTLAMLIIACLFKMARKMTSSGADFKIADTVGKNATVYQQIPADGRGKITITAADGLLRELQAVSADKTEIASFQNVKIIEVIDPKTVSVKKV